MSYRLKGTSVASAIKLAEGGKVPNEVQVLRVGKFNHPSYGAFEITRQVLAEMKANFEARARGVDICFDYFHKSDEEAAGWPGGLELREDGTELWAVNVDWTPKAAQKLAEREIRYFSPDFSFQWKDPETGVVHRNVLFGGGLTNRPFVKEMAAIVAHEKGETMTELEKAQAALKAEQEKNVKLSEQVAKLEGEVKAAAPGDEVAALKAEIEKLKAENATLKGDAEKMASEKKAAEEQKVLAEKKGEFQKLLSEGKAVAAQEKAFLDGNMAEFIKLAEPVNLDGKGSSKGGDDKNAGADDEDKILTLAEEKRKTDPKLTIGESISLAKKELKK